MIVRNKKNGTNILAFGSSRVIIKANETVDIPALINFEQIINKADFTQRGWFEIVVKNEDIKVIEKERITEVEIANIIEDSAETEEETSLEKAKKEVKEYTSKKKKK